jgi:hypothetical protein
MRRAAAWNSNSWTMSLMATSRYMSFNVQDVVASNCFNLYCLTLPRTCEQSPSRQQRSRGSRSCVELATSVNTSPTVGAYLQQQAELWHAASQVHSLQVQVKRCTIGTMLFVYCCCPCSCSTVWLGQHVVRCVSCTMTAYPHARAEVVLLTVFTPDLCTIPGLYSWRRPAWTPQSARR